jgi:hypothetical protein
MKMYTTKTGMITDENISIDDKIKMLDLKISRLSEEVNSLKSTIKLTSRATRRRTADVANLTTVVRTR